MTTPEEKEFFEALNRNDENAVKHLIEEKNIRITVTNFDQQNAAHIAVENGNLSLLKYLLKKDRELLTTVDKTNRNVLHLAVKKGLLDIVEYLVDNLNVDIYSSENRFYGDTVVHMAAEEDQLAILKYFLKEKQVDVNVQDEIGASPLFQAVEKIRMRIVKYLVEEEEANAVMKDFQRDNILFRSARTGDVTVPKYLLDERGIQIDVDWSNNFGRTIIHSAARHNHLDFIRYFVEEKKANFSLSNKLGWTPLHEAASEGNYDIIRYLVEKGAKADCKDMQGKTPLNVTKDERVIEYLKKVTKTRDRRSASELRYSPSTLELNPAPCNWIRHIITTSGLVESRHEADLSFNESPLQFHSLLTVASMVGRSGRKRINLSLPKDIVRNKVDPLAIDAVEVFSDR